MSDLRIFQSIQENLSKQQWPVGALYTIATPIGNLGDLSLRARMALAQADVVAAEDTRVSAQLLEAWGIRANWMALHKHNEASSVEKVCELLAQGQRVALISDAGAPGVSDPGAKLVYRVRQQGFSVIPLPGPSAVITALMASGMTSDENPAFVFAGFPPSKSQARQKWLKNWLTIDAPIVMYEAPHRIVDCLQDIADVVGPQREVCVARELTKRYEEIATLPIADLLVWMGEDKYRQQGEFVVIVAARQDNQERLIDAKAHELIELLMENLSVRDVAKVASKFLALPRDEVYRYALSLQPSER